MRFPLILTLLFFISCDVSYESERIGGGSGDDAYSCVCRKIPKCKNACHIVDLIPFTDLDKCLDKKIPTPCELANDLEF